MTVEFILDWASPRGFHSKSFKSKPAFDLFSDYTQRISQFTSVAVKGHSDLTHPASGTRIWLCRPSAQLSVSSEQIGHKLNSLLNSGAKKLQIVIGGPNGFPKNIETQIHPDFFWSFGAITLPHELAAIIASEQLYRAWTILRNLPYHWSH